MALDDVATRSKTQSWGTRLAAPERSPLEASRPAPPARTRGGRHLEGSHALLLAPLFHRLPRAARARSIWRQPGVDVAAACVEINQCVGRAIEQASRRWRGGRRDDSARTRRKILISTQAATPVEFMSLVEELVLVLGAFRARPRHAFHPAVPPFYSRNLSHLPHGRGR